MTKLILYHYSNEQFNGYIRPSFFGKNGFTSYSQNLCNIKRSYFYINIYEREYFFSGARYRYITDIDEKKLYNIDEDRLKIVNNKTQTDIYRYLIKKGYRGIIGTNGYKIVILFNKIKIKSQVNLTK